MTAMTQAQTDAGPPTPLSEIRYKATRRTTIGWLVYDDADALSLAQTYDTANEEVAFQDVMWIPRGCVRKRTFVPYRCREPGRVG